MDIEELSKKIERYREEDKNEVKKYRRENLGWIGWGFALAILSNYLTTKDINYVWFAITFFIIGFVLLTNTSKKKGENKIYLVLRYFTLSQSSQSSRETFLTSLTSVS